MNTAFIFSEGEWLGQGIITLSTSPEEIRFYTKWVIQKENNAEIKATQIVEREGVRENVINKFHIYGIKDQGFKISLESQDLGKVEGSGTWDEKSVAWEFHERVPFEGSLGFEGFEIYTKLENNEYHIHAEYYLEKEYRTFVEGKIWRKL